ncbi:hypothetical protein B0O99DRAFT_606641 [Bisporella sp. PMI_857]|nr:hypothetical protein B0O99DRAFT_606641 [Bisporella sp. PMI_857]
MSRSGDRSITGVPTDQLACRGAITRACNGRGPPGRPAGLKRRAFLSYAAKSGKLALVPRAVDDRAVFAFPPLPSAHLPLPLWCFLSLPGCIRDVTRRDTPLPLPKSPNRSFEPYSISLFHGIFCIMLSPRPGLYFSSAVHFFRPKKLDVGWGVLL